MQKLQYAPSGLPLREDMSVMEFYGVYPQDLPSVFEPWNFPPRECRPIIRRRTRAEIAALLEDCFSEDYKYQQP